MDEQKEFKNIFITPPVRTFLESCLADKGIKVDDQTKAEMVEGLAPDLQDWLWQATFSKLSNEDLPEWKALGGGSPTPEDVQTFFRSKITNYDEVIAEAMKEFKNTYVNA